jgi:hypothetical protein
MRGVKKARAQASRTVGSLRKRVKAIEKQIETKTKYVASTGDVLNQNTPKYLFGYQASENAYSSVFTISKGDSKNSRTGSRIHAKSVWMRLKFKSAHGTGTSVNTQYRLIVYARPTATGLSGSNDYPEKTVDFSMDGYGSASDRLLSRLAPTNQRVLYDKVVNPKMMAVNGASTVRGNSFIVNVNLKMPTWLQQTQYTVPNQGGASNDCPGDFCLYAAVVAVDPNTSISDTTSAVGEVTWECNAYYTDL